jgi:hypothetical protein
VVTARGTVYVSYFRLAKGRIDVYLARSIRHGTHFEKAVRITNVTFNPALSQPGDSP